MISPTSDYKERLKNEYLELKDKYNKLHKTLVKYDAGTLSFSPINPDILRKQCGVLGQYLYILEERAELEQIDLNS